MILIFNDIRKNYERKSEKEEEKKRKRNRKITAFKMFKTKFTHQHLSI